MSDASRAPRAAGNPHSFISGTRVIVERELGACFDSPIAYIYAAVFLVLSCAIFMNSFFLESVVDMSAYFEVLPFLLIPFIPAITMRSWAEEHAQGTFELISTLPLLSMQLVVGKYVAAILFYVLILCGTFPILFMLIWLGEPDLGLIFSGYVGAIFLGAFFLSFGLFVSGLTRNQIVAFVLATLAGFAFVLSGHPDVVEVVDGLVPMWQLGTWVSESLSALPHFEAFTRGVIGLEHLLYFVLMSAFFIWMNEITLRRSKF
jgi:ABC-2 type transport system permease protein